MASRRVKDEPVDDLPLFMRETPAADRRRLARKYAPRSQHQPLGIEPMWRASFDTLDQECTVKQTAAESGVQFLVLLKATLKSHASLHAGLEKICQLWIDRIDDIVAEKVSSPVFLGLIGGTGTGKSTLINSLLDLRGLLPVSSLNACTSVCCEVAYNRSEDPNALYRAEVNFVNRDDWRKELEVTFVDVEAHFSGLDEVDDGSGEGDADRLNRIRDALVTLKIVYPHLETVEDLRATSVEELMGNKKVASILGSTKNIQRPNGPSFTKAIRPYIATSESLKRNLDHWPLITCVKVFVKVDFLESGIVLVDLPGNMDRNTARGSIAMNYLQKLAAPLIVANAVRGIDDRNAHLVLEEVMKTNFQLDGVYNSCNLCFILSKFDTVYDVGDYMDQNDHLRESLSPVLAKNQDLLESIHMLKEKLAKAEGNRASAEDAKISVGAQIEEVTKTPKSQGRAPAKRKRGVAETPASSSPVSITTLRRRLTALKETAYKEADTIDLLNKRKKGLESEKSLNMSKIHSACHKHRKEKASAAVRNDFENNLREMGRTESGEALQVFCTASMVYLDYLTMQETKQGKKKPAFPDPESTDIPRLRSWIVKFTLPSRIAKADAVLEGIERLMMSMKPWVDDRSGDIKLSAQERVVRESGCDYTVSELADKLSELSTCTTTELKQLVKSHVYDEMADFEQVAATRCHDIVRSWGIDLRWNTHRAVNQRHGEWVDGRENREHIWNIKLASEYKKNLVQAWDYTFHELVPRAILAYMEKQKILIAKSASKIASRDAFPHHAIVVEILKEQLLKSSNIAASHSQTVVSHISHKTRDAHRVSPSTIQNFLEPMYDECAKAGGTGHFKRNKDFHQKHMRENGSQMYQEVSRAIQESLNKLLDDIPKQFAAGSASIIREIRQELSIFFEQNSSTGSRTTLKKTKSKTKETLQNALAPIIHDLSMAWNENVEFTAEEAPDMSCFDYEDDISFNSKSIQNDDDYEFDGSDGDD